MLKRTAHFKTGSLCRVSPRPGKNPSSCQTPLLPLLKADNKPLSRLVRMKSKPKMLFSSSCLPAGLMRSMICGCESSSLLGAYLCQSSCVGEACEGRWGLAVLINSDSKTMSFTKQLVRDRLEDVSGYRDTMKSVV